MPVLHEDIPSLAPVISELMQLCEKKEIAHFLRFIFDNIVRYDEKNEQPKKHAMSASFFSKETLLEELEYLLHYHGSGNVKEFVSYAWEICKENQALTESLNGIVNHLINNTKNTPYVGIFIPPEPAAIISEDTIYQVYDVLDTMMQLLNDYSVGGGKIYLVLRPY